MQPNIKKSFGIPIKVINRSLPFKGTILVIKKHAYEILVGFITGLQQNNLNLVAD